MIDLAFGPSSGILRIAKIQGLNRDHEILVAFALFFNASVQECSSFRLERFLNSLRSQADRTQQF